MSEPVRVEEWRRVPGYSWYEVSNLGRVRSWRRRGGFPVPRILTGAPDAGGYLQITMKPDGEPRARKRKVHQLVVEAHLGPRPAGMVTRHLDGDNANNVLANLRYGTPAENAADSLRHGTNWQASKTHCPCGHAYDELNTIVESNPRRGRGVQRRCRECLEQRMLERNLRRRVANRTATS